VLPQQRGDVACRTIAESNPDDLGRCAEQHAQSVEVLVRRDEDGAGEEQRRERNAGIILGTRRLLGSS
jgi:hypothetical protein